MKIGALSAFVWRTKVTESGAGVGLFVNTNRDLGDRYIAIL